MASSSTKSLKIGAELPSSLIEAQSPSTYVAASDGGNAQEIVRLNFDLIEHLDLGNLLERTNEVTIPPVFPATHSDTESCKSEDDNDSLMEELVRLSRKQQNAGAPDSVVPISLHLTDKSESVKDKPQDFGLMTEQSVTSTGVTACLSSSSSRKCTDTVFLDLRGLAEEALEVIYGYG